MDNPFKILASPDFNKYYGKLVTDCGTSAPTPEKHTQTQVMSHWGDVDTFCNKYGFYQESSLQELVSAPQDVECMIKNDYQSVLPDSSELVTNPTKNVSEPNLSDPNCSEPTRKLSTCEILKLAGERFVQFSSQKFVNINMFETTCGSSLDGLFFSDKQDVELAQLLLAAAEKVSRQQFDRANGLIGNCQWIALNEGTPVQRVVYYFCEALLEKINKETGEFVQEQIAYEACLKRNILAVVNMHQELPFFQVVLFTAVQTILENVSTKSRVHLFDFHILTGLQWATFMQAMAEQRIESLKITAVETIDKSGAERTGELLKSFARHLNLPFSYNVVFLSDIRDLNEEHFANIEPDEAVAFFFPFALRTLISKPVGLKHLMALTERIKPSIVVVGEVEANHNSPSYVNRFIEALFYYGALFDSLEESMARENKHRMVIETGTFREGIRNIVASEGHARVTRSVTISVWRAFFARFGMEELELSSACLHQACLIVKKYACGQSCTLDITSKCLLVGWKGTPLFSLSAWKFH